MGTTFVYKTQFTSIGITVNSVKRVDCLFPYSRQICFASVIRIGEWEKENHQINLFYSLEQAGSVYCATVRYTNVCLLDV